MGGDKNQNLIGVKFGMLTVIERCGLNNDKKRLWLCKCDCGNFKKYTTSHLKRGVVVSCTCLQKAGIRGRKHGLANSKEYNVWLGIKRRCYTEKDPGYKNYGGRGIKVCDRWLESFENFIEDMGFRPEGDYSLERKDNDKWYCKENCKWATRIEQSKNKRSNIKVLYRGEIYILSEFSKLIGHNATSIKRKLDKKLSGDEIADYYKIKKSN